MFDRSVRDEIAALVAERDWAQFHSPDNLATSTAIEAAELLECFPWNAGANDSRVGEELADALTYSLLLAERIGADPEQIILDKLAATRLPQHQLTRCLRLGRCPGRRQSCN